MYVSVGARDVDPSILWHPQTNEIWVLGRHHSLGMTPDEATDLAQRLIAAVAESQRDMPDHALEPDEMREEDRVAAAEAALDRVEDR